MSRKLATLVLTILLSFGLITVIYAATNDKPVELAADTIEYDSAQGIMNAQGSVTLTRDKAVLTGASAQYNTKTKEAVVSGGVKVVREDTTMTADEVRSYNDNYLVATGQATLVKGGNTVTGPKIEHWIDKQYSLVASNARLTMQDGVMTSDKLEVFHSENRAVGTGDVHIVSEKRNLDATADIATYFGPKTAQGKVILSGNARAVQDGNVITGKTLTIYLDDKAMDAQGRSKLVVTPQ